jgi:hypothetical protein
MGSSLRAVHTSSRLALRRQVIPGCSKGPDTAENSKSMWSSGQGKVESQAFGQCTEKLRPPFPEYLEVDLGFANL